MFRKELKIAGGLLNLAIHQLGEGADELRGGVEVGVEGVGVEGGSVDELTDRVPESGFEALEAESGIDIGEGGRRACLRVGRTSSRSADSSWEAMVKCAVAEMEGAAPGTRVTRWVPRRNDWSTRGCAACGPQHNFGVEAPSFGSKYNFPHTLLLRPFHPPPSARLHVFFPL